MAEATRSAKWKNGGVMPAAEAQLRATDLDLAAIGPAISLPQAVSGTGSAVVDISTRGSNLGAQLDGLNGSARLDIRQGDVPSFGIAGLAAEADLASAAPIESLTPVPVDAVSLGFSFSGGVAVLERATWTTPTYAAETQGWIGLRDGTLGLNGTLQAVTSGTAAGATIPFAIDGRLADPQARPLVLAN